MDQGLARSVTQRRRADEIMRAGMRQRRLDIEPYLAAEIAPKLAEAEILAEIFAG